VRRHALQLVLRRELAGRRRGGGFGGGAAHGEGVPGGDFWEWDGIVGNQRNRRIREMVVLCALLRKRTRTRRGI
jgi:hypothetical protein